MNTLREIGAFIGMSPGTRLRSASDIVIGPGVQISMREVIRLLQTLPPLRSLEATAENTVGEVPFRVILHVHPSTGGAVLETQAGLFRNGQLVGSGSKDTGGPARDLVFEVVDPGSYVLEVTRTGVTSTGFTTLRKTFNVQGRAKPAPPPPRPEPIVPPFISVKSSGDGSFTVSGSKFLPNATVTIRVVDAVQPLSPNLFFTVSATPEGEIKDFPTGKICQVPGGRIAFSAQDGRIDAGQAVTSNFIQQTCPFPK